MPNIQLSASAYTIPLLHAAKHTSSSVCGALLGKTDGPNLQITEAVPILHQWTSLTPMLEVALRQTEQHATKKSLKIVGWYHANEDIQDDGLPERATRIADLIKKQFENAVILLIDNKAFTKLEEGAFIPYFSINNQWKKVQDSLKAEKLATVEQPQQAYAKTRELISSSAYQNLHDFDEALENTLLDWLNNEFI